MSDKFVSDLYILVKREQVRCSCIVLCVIIVMASVIGLTLYCFPPPLCSAQPTTYTHTDANGTTTTTTTNGRQTITTVTTADGNIIAYSSIGSRSSTSTRQNTERQEQRARERAERAAQRKARQAERKARQLERKAERLERQAERARARANR